MTLSTDTSNRNAYEAAIAAILCHGSLRRAFDHYRSLEAVAKVRAEQERRKLNARLARLLLEPFGISPGLLPKIPQ